MLVFVIDDNPDDLAPFLPKPRFLQGAVLIGEGDTGVPVRSHGEGDPEPQ